MPILAETDQHVADKVAAKGISDAPSDKGRGHAHQGAARVPDLVCRLAT